MQMQYLVDCDDVILMREGTIMEQGSHDHLMKLNRDYAAMFKNFQQGDTAYIEVPVYLSHCLSIYLYDCLFVRLSDRLLDDPSVCMTACQSDCLSVFMTVSLLVCLSVCSRLPLGRQAALRGSRRTANRA